MSCHTTSVGIRAAALAASAQVGLAPVFLATQAQAQSFNQMLVFGDSSVDSGFYRALPNPGGGPLFNSLWAAAVATGEGVPTTSPGLMNSQVLAKRFRIDRKPG